MTRRTYGQYCGLAKALDLVGERWTPLLIRDLALRPRRYTELLSGLEGIGTNLLSERLRRLEDAAVVQREAAPRPAAGVVYRLTPAGEHLARALVPLAAWGAGFLEDDDPATFRPEWLMYVLKSSFRPRDAKGVHDCYRLRIQGSDIWVTVDDGSIELDLERPRDPDFALTTDVPTLAAIGSGRLTVQDAVDTGAATFEGDAAAGTRALRLLRSP